MFSCPSGMNVSSSRAPPPNVTTTALRFLFAAMPRVAEGANKAAPVAARRKLRRFSEISEELRIGYWAYSLFYCRNRRLAAIPFAG